VGELGGWGVGVTVTIMVVGIGVGMEVEKTGVMGGGGVDWQAVKVRMMRISRKVMVLVCPETNGIALS
jgi:hypothetical protein